jgi:hypothetical protein
MHSPITLLETRLPKRVRQVILVGILCLVVLSFGAFSFAPPAHAATVPGSTAKAAVVTPNINRVDCVNRADWLRIWTDVERDLVCFANAGTMRVTLYNVNLFCSGNNSGIIYWYYDDPAIGRAFGSTPFSDYTCKVPSGDQRILVVVDLITIY